MTDTSDDQSDDSRSTTSESQIGESVPEDTEWDVVAQQPFDTSGSSGLTPTIISAVAEAEDVSPRDVKEPRLYDVVDTAALEAALFGSESKVRTSQGSTEFMYRGYRVVVRTDGWVLVTERADR